MRTVLALQFDVLPPAGKTPDACMDEIERLLRAWVARKYTKAWNVSFKPDFSGQLLNPQPGHECVAVRQSSGEFHFTTLDWTHPDDDDATLLWKTSCTLCSDASKIETSIVVRIASERFLVKPAHNYVVGRPRIVDDIVGAYRCEIQGDPIPTEVELITTDNVSHFIASDLENRSRVLPLVILSRDAWTEKPFVNPDDVQKRLLGLAKVAVLDKYAGFDLTAAIGKQLSCYNGAIRVYWPGFSRTADPWQHPLYLPDRMREREAMGNPIEQYLFILLSDIAALRFTEGPVTRLMQLNLQKSRVDEVAQLRHQLHDNNLSVVEMEHELERTWDENATLSKELQKAQQRIQELESEIAQHKENYAAIFEYQPSGARSPVAIEEIPVTVESVVEALGEAEHRFGVHLRIWDTAKTVAKKSHFTRPREVFEALEAIAELSEKYFESKRSGESMGAWEHFFESHGIKYAPAESKNTLNMYGSQRMFVDRGQKKQMLKHVTLGGGDRTNCIQIYFEPNEDAQQMDIGYCGVHLEYYGMRT